MSTAATRTSIDSVIKDIYPDMEVVEMAFKRKDNALFATMAKGERMEETMEGRKIVIPLRVARPMGRSAAFATAQTNCVPSTFEAFEISPVTNYAVAQIDGIAISTTKSNRGAFIKVLTTEIDGAIEEIVRDASKNFYRGRSGALGVAGTISTTSCILATIEDISNFELGMEIVTAADEALATDLRDSGQANTVTGINRVTGDVVSSDDWSTIASFAAGDVMFCEGDAPGSTSTHSWKKMNGLVDWLLTANPGGSDSFNGVNRSVDSRLWGTYYNGSSDSIDTALFNGQSVAKSMHGGSIDAFYMNPKNVRQLVSALGSKVEYQVTPAQGGQGPIGTIGFSALKIHGDSGEVAVYSDVNCQVGTAWGLQMDTWKLHSMGPMPRILDEDGLRIQRLASADGYEVRIGYYGNISCNNPGANVRVLLPS